MYRLLTLLLVFLLLHTGICLSQVLVPRVEVGEEEDLPPLECIKSIVNVEIDNQIARVHIEQLFKNNTEGDLECVYFLPLHESASISRFSYWVKGEEIEGKIKEKEEAREIYEQIVAQKRDPALLEYAGTNLFRTNIYPVSPDEPMKVVIEYSQICNYDTGMVTFSYPLTAGGQEQKIDLFAVNVKVKDQKPIKNILATSHGGATSTLQDEHNGTVSFEKTDFIPDKDFQIRYELKSKEFGVSFLTHRPEDEDGYFMLTVAPQEETEETDIVKKDIIFVFDKSGSMEGEKIQQAKDALKYCINNLGNDDRFSLVIFSDTVLDYSDELLDASSDNVEDALQYIRKIDSGGGTNINDALLQAMGMFEDSTNQKTIIFLTDGLPTVGEDDAGNIIKNVNNANALDVRLFTFGVGDDVDDYLLLKLASDNHGAEKHVRKGESIESKVSEFYAKVAKPVLVNLEIDFGDIKTSYVYPEVLPDIFKGSQLIITGRYSNEGDEDIILTGEINGESRTFEYSADFPEEEEENNFLARIWAKSRVDWAIDQMRMYGEDEELKEEVISLSKEYMFITPYTSFLALPKEEQEALANTSQPSYPTGGDPLLRVLAPQDTKRIVAVFPWGETKSLKIDKSGYWQCRFIVPKNLAHGNYDVVVIISPGSGSKQRMVVSFQADRENPDGTGESDAVCTVNGWMINLSIEATDDTYRAQAIMPGDKTVELELNEDTNRWEGKLSLDKSYQKSSIMVPVILFDRGHNHITIEVEVELN